MPVPVQSFFASIDLSTLAQHRSNGNNTKKNRIPSSVFWQVPHSPILCIVYTTAHGLFFNDQLPFWVYNQINIKYILCQRRHVNAGSRSRGLKKKNILDNHHFFLNLPNRATIRRFSVKLHQFSEIHPTVPLTDTAYLSKHFLSVLQFTTKVLFQPFDDTSICSEATNGFPVLSSYLRPGKEINFFAGRGRASG